MTCSFLKDVEFSDLVVFFALQLFAKLEAVKAEIHEIQEAHISARQQLEQTQNELTRDLKLKYGTC